MSSPFDPTASTTPGTVLPIVPPTSLPKKKGGISKGCLAALGCGLCLGMFGVVTAAGAGLYFLRAGSAMSTVGGPVAVYAPPERQDTADDTTPPEHHEEAQPSPRQTAAPRPRAQATARPEATPRAARTVVARVERTPVVPAPLPWDDSAKTTPPAVATPASTVGAFPPSTPAVVAPTPKAIPADPNARVIHARAGDKTVNVNRNVAITGSDGKTLVGVLVNVANGYVDIRVKGQLMRIAEQDVTDAASY